MRLMALRLAAALAFATTLTQSGTSAAGSGAAAAGPATSSITTGLSGLTIASGARDKLGNNAESTLLPRQTVASILPETASSTPRRAALLWAGSGRAAAADAD